MAGEWTICGRDRSVQRSRRVERCEPFDRHSRAARHLRAARFASASAVVLALAQITVSGCNPKASPVGPSDLESAAARGRPSSSSAVLHAEADAAVPSDGTVDGSLVHLPSADGGPAADMVRIPAGEFMMGSNDGQADERPVHSVVVASFELDSTEVTASAYAGCVAAGACTAAGKWKLCNYGQLGKDNHPINCVEWHQAEAFCHWLGKRLPAEEEWEYAARGTDQRSFPWGNEEPEGRACWKRSVSKQGTCEVATLPAGDSPFGLHDMAGNVWEWTSSGYSNDYRSKRQTNQYVCRGGSWGDVNASFFRAAERGSGPPRQGNNIIGFRCAR